LASNNEPLKIFWSATLFFSTVYGHRKVNETEYEKEKPTLKFKKTNIIRNFWCIIIVYLQNQEKLYFYLDSLYQNFSKQVTDVLN
jgi:cobalt-zinc-cadmium resistance protein CzcA